MIKADLRFVLLLLFSSMAAVTAHARNPICPHYLSVFGGRQRRRDGAASG